MVAKVNINPCVSFPIIPACLLKPCLVPSIPSVRLRASRKHLNLSTNVFCARDCCDRSYLLKPSRDVSPKHVTRESLACDCHLHLWRSLYDFSHCATINANATSAALSGPYNELPGTGTAAMAGAGHGALLLCLPWRQLSKKDSSIHIGVGLRSLQQPAAACLEVANLVHLHASPRHPVVGSP